MKWPVPLAEVGEGGANRERHAIDVREDHGAPVLRRSPGEAALGAEAGVRERDVEAAEGVERERDEACWSSHSVTSQRTASGLVGPPSSSASSSSSSSRAGAEHDRSRVAAGARRGGADATRGASDQDHR